MRKLEELRQWHWGKCLQARRLADIYASSNRPKLAKASHLTANHHLSAVHLLNNVCQGDVV